MDTFGGNWSPTASWAVWSCCPLLTLSMDVLPEWQMSLLLLMEPAQKVRVWDGSGQALSAVVRAQCWDCSIREQGHFCSGCEIAGMVGCWLGLLGPGEYRLFTTFLYFAADDNIPAKILSYNRANRAVAILCNHQRAPPKTFEKSMMNLQSKVLWVAASHESCFLSDEEKWKQSLLSPVRNWLVLHQRLACLERQTLEAQYWAERTTLQLVIFYL